MSRIATQAVHAGRRADGDTGAILTPIHQVTTYAQADIGVHKGHTYSRASNPTVAALEERLAALEGGIGAVCFASGMAAIDAVLRRFSSGDHVVLSGVVYGGTVRLLREIYARHGIGFTLADASDPSEVKRSLTQRTRLVLLETPANPTLKLADIRAVSDVCRAAGVPLAVDNTFLTPYGQRALDLGADLAIHSTTKYLEGHNTTIGGAVVAREDAGWLEWLTLVRKSAGTNLAPFEAWLTLRGIKTLPVRLDRHAENASEVARFLAADPAVERVHYPWLPEHPQYALARRQQRHGGGVVAFEVRGGLEGARRLARGLKVITIAENLGSVESMLTHPATMTHGAYTPEERQALGVVDGLLRLSVGLEDVKDLVEDLTNALQAVAPPQVARPAGGAAY